MSDTFDDMHMIILGDHKYEIISSNDMEEDYYTIKRDDGFSFIISCNEDGDWITDAHVDAVVQGIGALIDTNDL